jgi:hypothetical protein
MQEYLYGEDGLIYLKFFFGDDASGEPMNILDKVG